GSPRALDVDDLANLAVQRFGDERVVTAPTLADAVETAIAIAEEAGEGGEPVSGAGIVITGSVVTAGAARSLFGKDPA
ncbi:dihydrofolate synthase, partial [Nocardia gipuzkoensis]